MKFIFLSVILWLFCSAALAQSVTGQATPLPVLQGGTGTTTSTGTGNVVLSASPTMTGTISAASMNASGGITGGSFAVSAASIPSTGIYRSSTNTLTFSTNSLYAGAVDANQHWRAGGVGTPTIASGACGTGTNGTIATNGNDQGFEVLVGSVATTTCTITFASAFATAPREAQLTPADAAASVSATTQDYVSTLSTTTLVITGAALANADYYVQVW